MDLDYDTWVSNRNKGVTQLINSSDVEVVFKRLEALDQKIHTQLIVGTKAGNLMVGGGSGSYVCTYTQGDNQAFFNLINPTATNNEDEPEVDIVTGGQAGLFPPKIVVTKELAAQALSYFIKYQQMDSSLIWEED